MVSDDENLTERIGRQSRLAEVLTERGIDPSYVIAGSDELHGEFTRPWLVVKLSMRIDEADRVYIKHGIGREE